jgi:hypothetical protein
VIARAFKDAGVEFIDENGGGPGLHGDRVKRFPKLTERKRIKARRAAKVVLMPAAEGPIAICDGEPKRSSLDHDSVHDEP